MYSMQAKFIKKFALSQNFRKFGCWQKFYPNPSINCENGILTIVGIAETATESIPESR